MCLQGLQLKLHSRKNCIFCDFEETTEQGCELCSVFEDFALVFLGVLLPRESSNKNTKDGKNTKKTFGDRLALKMKIWNFTISGTSLYCFFSGGKRQRNFPAKIFHYIFCGQLFSNFWILQFFSFLLDALDGENSTWRNKNLGCHFWKKKSEKKIIKQS